MLQFVFYDYIKKGGSAGPPFFISKKSNNYLHVITKISYICPVIIFKTRNHGKLF